MKLVLSIWQGQGLDKLPTAQVQEPVRAAAAAEDQEVPEQETSKSQDKETNDSN